MKFSRWDSFTYSCIIATLLGAMGFYIIGNIDLPLLYENIEKLLIYAIAYVLGMVSTIISVFIRDFFTEEEE